MQCPQAAHHFSSQIEPKLNELKKKLLSDLTNSPTFQYNGASYPITINYLHDLTTKIFPIFVKYLCECTGLEPSDDIPVPIPLTPNEFISLEQGIFPKLPQEHVDFLRDFLYQDALSEDE